MFFTSNIYSQEQNITNFIETLEQNGMQIGGVCLICDVEDNSISPTDNVGITPENKYAVSQKYISKLWINGDSIRHELEGTFYNWMRDSHKEYHPKMFDNSFSIMTYDGMKTTNVSGLTVKNSKNATFATTKSSLDDAQRIPLLSDVGYRSVAKTIRDYLRKGFVITLEDNAKMRMVNLTYKEGTSEARCVFRFDRSHNDYPIYIAGFVNENGKEDILGETIVEKVGVSSNGFPYPAQVLKKVFALRNEKNIAIRVTKYVAKEYNDKIAIEADKFKQEIPVGVNVADIDTGITYVSGGMIDQTLEDEVLKTASDDLIKNTNEFNTHSKNDISTNANTVSGNKLDKFERPVSLDVNNSAGVSMHKNVWILFILISGIMCGIYLLRLRSKRKV
jgi:hypothetical protein